VKKQKEAEKSGETLIWDYNRNLWL